MNAFVPSSLTPPRVGVTSFSGAAVSSRPPTRNMQTPTMGALDKYAAMSADQMPKAPRLAPSSPSSVWVAYRDSLKERFNPFRAARNPKVTTGYSAAALAAVSTPYARFLSVIAASKFGAGGDPDTMINVAPVVAADRYMARSVTAQYKTVAVPGGVYSVRCAEETTKMQAEEARSAALSAEFRLKQRTSKQKFGDFTETRRKAVIAAAGCSYEENLVNRFPIAARAVVRGGSEAKGVCSRYAVGDSVEEKYMAGSVGKQSRFRSVPYGVYDVLCSDGNTKGVAEYKRVSTLAAKFRAKQLSSNAKAQMKYDAAKYARDFYGHGCSYEETYFNKYAAVAASMRPDAARYA